MQHLQSFRSHLCVQGGDAGQVAAGAVQAGNEADLNRIGASDEDNRNCAGCTLGGHRRLAVCRNYGDLTTNQIGRQSRQAVNVSFRPAVFDPYIQTLDIARFFQALTERDNEAYIFRGAPRVQKANHRHRRLLRAYREGPCDRRTAEQRDELAALHSIASSMRINTDSGISMPSAFAVRRLTITSVLIAC